MFETSEAELGSKISLIAVHIGGQAEVVSNATILLAAGVVLLNVVHIGDR